ncbi:IPExxxVDY family protein [Gaetbulibacter jejuensis]|uniref:IPExxxVDY family protein n=1 Tax=Gaetbulibacter jejuensis TaxID=584607 RepID=UPI0030092B17
MALHKLLVDDFYDASFTLLAIHCRLEDYRLAYLLNKNLEINLERKPQDLDYKYFSASYSIYEWEDKEQYTTWNLMSNVCKKEEDSLQSTGSLFEAQGKVLKIYHLLPELKNVDYLFKIDNDTQYLNEKIILNKIQSIPQVITAYSVDVEQLKSKDHLIF